MGGCCGKDGKSDFDPRNKGPIKNRSCTDICCCVFFFVVIIAYVIVGIFAWLNGDPVILLYPTDNQGRICGVEYGDLDLSEKTNLFFFDLTKCAGPGSSIKFQCSTTQVCVNACPNETWTYLQDLASISTSFGATNAAKATGVDWSKYYCEYNYNIQTEYEKGTNGAEDLNNIIQSGKCASYTVASDPLIHRCIPAVAGDAASYASDFSSSMLAVDKDNNTVNGTELGAGSKIVQDYLNLQEIGTKLFADFTTSWYWILAGIGIAAIISFIWIVVMRWIAGPMVWITIFGLLGVMGFGIYYTFTEWQRLLNVNGTDTTNSISVGVTTSLSQYLTLKETWLAFFIILCVVTFIFLVLVIFLRKRILIAIEIIKAASKAVSHMISTLFYPLVTFILALIVIAFWAATELFLASSGDPVYKIIVTNTSASSTVMNLSNTNCNITEWNDASHDYANDDTVKCMFIEYGGDSLMHQNMLWIQIAIVFVFFWLMNWVIALGECSLAGAYASYYWAFDKSKDIPALPLFSSFARALRYHTGSLAFGSFIIAIVQVIRVVLEFLDSKLQGSENKVAKFCLCICKCCCWCLEKFLSFLNRNAYIMIAVYGKNFCWSAKQAFKLILRNIVRVVVVDKVTDFLLFMGKLIVTAGLVALSWAFFGNKITFTSSIVPSLNYFWMPIVIIGIGSYIIAAGFFNTYAMAVDTVFLCFLEDLERNDGSAEKPYFMSKGLMKVLGKKNKKPIKNGDGKKNKDNWVESEI